MVVGEIAIPVEVLVVGGGPGGYTAAARAAALGKEVVLIEQNRLGGVCLQVGCIPSKALIDVAEQRHRLATEGPARGLDVAVPDFDPATWRAWTDGIIDDLTAGVGQVLSGVTVVTGTARLLDGRRVSVETGDQVSHYRFDHCILATGSSPVSLPGLPLDGERVVDSTGALELSAVPEHLVVVGGGYIGLELGMAWAKLGANVTIVEALDRIGTGFDQSSVSVLEESLEELGVTIMTATRAIRDDGNGLVVASAGGTEQVVPADCILVAVGRVPNTTDLQVDRADIEVADGHVVTDDRMRTSSRRIFAIGDLVVGPALAHKASTQGRVAAEVIAGLPSAFDQVVPLIAFTDPELAAVGPTAAEAEDMGIAVVVGTAMFSHSGRAKTMGSTRGRVVMVVDVDSEMIVGVHLVGPHVSDLASWAAMAVESALRVDDVVGTIHPHPTLGEILHDAALDARRRLDRRRTSAAN